MDELTIDDLKSIEMRGDAQIVFHGTSTCFSVRIERDGLPLLWRPYSRCEIEFLQVLSDTLNVDGRQSVYLDVNYRCQMEGSCRGPYFTYLVDGAIEYARYTGGETIRCGFARAEQLLNTIGDSEQYAFERAKLIDLIGRWRPMIEQSHPVIYVIRASERTFPEVLPTQIGAFEYQRSNWGEIIQRPGNFRSDANISPADIVGKALVTGKSRLA